MNRINFLKNLLAIPIVGSLTIKDKSKVLDNKSIVKPDLKTPEWIDTGVYRELYYIDERQQYDKHSGETRWVQVFIN